MKNAQRHLFFFLFLFQGFNKMDSCNLRFGDGKSSGRPRRPPMGADLKFLFSRADLPASIEEFKQRSKYFHVVLENRIYFAGATVSKAVISRCTTDDEDVMTICFQDLIGSLRLERYEDLSLHDILRFIRNLNRRVLYQPTSKIICCLDPSECQVDGMFLMGCYLVENFHQNPDLIWNAMSESMIEHCSSRALGGLSILDLWKALHHAHHLGWTNESCAIENFMLPLPVHEIIPGGLVAFFAIREASPVADATDHNHLCAARLAKMGVRTAMQLSANPGAAPALEQHGICPLPLDSDDPVLAPSVLTLFLRAARHGGLRVGDLRFHAGIIFIADESSLTSHH